MLCSRCSETIHPVVALDIDGTLGDYHGHLINFAKGYFQREPADDFQRYDGRDEFKFWFSKAFGISVDEFRQMKLAYRQGGMKRSMPPFAGVRELFGMLERQHAEVWLCTTRPYLRLDNIDPDTRFWLANNGATYYGMLYDEDKYDQLFNRVWADRVVAVLDDLPSQVEAAGRNFGPGRAIMMANEYNYGVRARITVGGLDEARLIIEQRILRWRSENA